MIRFLILASALLFGGLLSCDSGRDGTPQVAGGPEDATTDAAPPLEGTIWEFIEVEGEPVVHFDNEEVPQIRLVVADHTLTASLSCNLFKGTYATDGEGLLLQLTPVTWRDCISSRDQEDLLRRVIQSVTRHRFDDGRLQLLAESRVVAVLAPMEAP